jgi:putative transposase
MSSTVALPEYVEHYHNERNHQGVGNRLLAQPERSTTAARRAVGRVQRRERLGGLLSFYHRNAA